MTHSQNPHHHPRHHQKKSFSKKVLASFVVLFVVSGTALAFSGIEIGGTYIGKVPWWCIKPSAYVPPENNSGWVPGSSRPGSGPGSALIPGSATWNSNVPGGRSGGMAEEPEVVTRFSEGYKDSIKKAFEKLDPLTPEIGGSETDGSDYDGGKGVLFPGGAKIKIPGVKIPGTGGTGGGENTPTYENKAIPGNWGYELKCPEGYQVDWMIFENSCHRIKKSLELGLYTEKTAPPEVQKILKLCPRFGKWFTLTKSAKDCETEMKKYYGGEKYDPAILEYCWKMKEKESNEFEDKWQNDCVNYKKNGGYIDPEILKMCEKSIWWWDTNAGKDDCEKIFKTMSNYKAAGGDYCDLPMGKKSAYCLKAYSDMTPDDYKGCEKGGGGDAP